MKPILNNPIPADLNAWLQVFPGLKLAYDRLAVDVEAGKPIVPTTYYKLAGDKNTTGHHVSILAIRMAVFIWIQTGLLDPETFKGLDWSHGDVLVQYAPGTEVTLITEDQQAIPVPQNREILKTALVIIGTNKDQPGALIYVNEDKVLRWETPSDEHEFQKADQDLPMTNDAQQMTND